MGHGFQRFGFNLAMLAKQAWRLVTEPNLLLCRILKARYFPWCLSLRLMLVSVLRSLGEEVLNLGVVSHKVCVRGLEMV